MQKPQAPLYGAVELKNLNYSNIHEVHNNQDKSLAPQRLDSIGGKVLRGCLDSVIAAVAISFLVFGYLVYKNDGKPPTPGSEAALLVSIGKYGPTVFPILFAAIVGGAMKSIATWKIQKGTTLGIIEQFLGSNSISGAIMTQFNMRAFNILGLFIVILWCLSPLGSQASLRVASVIRNYPSNITALTAMDTFAEYQYGGAEGVSEAVTTVVAPFTAALMSASLLKNRNQDLWGNIRLPSIERLVGDGNMSLINISDPTNLEYPSLVGLPLTTLPNAGNTTFMLSGSYLNVTCGVLELRSTLTNFTSSNTPDPGGNTDCEWVEQLSDGILQIAISEPCNGVQINNGTRDARKLVWESQGAEVTHAECELYTTYVDVNMSCVGTTCLPSSVQRTPQPARDRNWTVFDFESGSLDPRGFLLLFSQMFPYARVSGGLLPTVSYFVDPYNAVTSTNMTDVYDVGKTVFEMRLAQMLNSQLVLGIAPSSVTGNLDLSLLSLLKVHMMNISAISTVEQNVVYCNRIWLGVLVITSTTLFLIAFITALLRLRILVPDVLGTLSIATLENKCQEFTGNSTWTAVERAVWMRDVKVQLGDIHPENEVGKIALAAPSDSTLVQRVRRGRLYE